jgi:hypothetical protein
VRGSRHWRQDYGLISVEPMSLELKGAPVGNSHLIVEAAVVDWWADTKVASVVFLCCLTENVGRRVPEDLLA